ncbi:MAG TPA: kelch repeat-containing protein [Candidatus Sulfotelmatobacter sp.]|nr:kelch repeat-containing protein [Candidatus Sulfotelmatobacter sp.]
MRKLLIVLAVAGFALLTQAAEEPKIPSIPVAVSSNAVASLKGGFELFSLMGVGPRKTWDDITNRVFVLNIASGKWKEGRPVPGVAGRLDAAAAGAKGKLFVFGGYVVDAQGNEMTVPDVNAYTPDDRRWYRASDIPVAVDGAVIGVTHDRFIYLIGGRSKSGPTNSVQVYDSEKDTWSQATASPGTPVFGHAGTVLNDTIVYVDGAAKNPAGSNPSYISSSECWMGKIDRKDPNKITWSKLPAHPGPAHFGIAAGEGYKDHRIYFSGGTANPHNFKGLQYDGKPAEASPVTFAFDLHGSSWETVSESTPYPRLDSGGILGTLVGNLVMGGMLQNQVVTAGVTVVPKK